MHLPSSTSPQDESIAITSGVLPKSDNGSDVGARRRRNGAAAATEKLAGFPVGVQSDDRTLLPALRAQPAPPSFGRRGGGLSAQLCREADPFQPPPHGRLCAAHACPGTAPHRRLRGRLGCARCCF